MLAIPSTLQKQFEKYLISKAISNTSHGVYKKWLRYYLDFCRKYHFSPEHQTSLPHFIQKLQEKRQTRSQQEQASKAIALYYQIIHTRSQPNKTKNLQQENTKEYKLEIDKPFVNRVAATELIKYGSSPD